MPGAINPSLPGYSTDATVKVLELGGNNRIRRLKELLLQIRTIAE